MTRGLNDAAEFGGIDGALFVHGLRIGVERPMAQLVDGDDAAIAADAKQRIIRHP
jgi:hypothetical protein